MRRTLHLLVSLHFDDQLYLPFGVGVGAELGDAAIEEVAPAHVEEDGELFVVGAGDVAYVAELLFALVVVVHGNGIGVVTVVGFAYEAEWGAHLELIPHFISLKRVAGRIGFIFNCIAKKLVFTDIVKGGTHIVGG